MKFLTEYFAEIIDMANKNNLNPGRVVGDVINTMLGR